MSSAPRFCAIAAIRPRATRSRARASRAANVRAAGEAREVRAAARRTWGAAPRGGVTPGAEGAADRGTPRPASYRYSSTPPPISSTGQTSQPSSCAAIAAAPREEHQHPDGRADAREPPRQPSRGGDADVLARDEDPQQHVGDDRDAEQRPDLPRDHHERQTEQGPHGQRAHAEVLGEPAGYPRDHLVRGAPAQRAARRGGGLGRRQLGGHGARWRVVGRPSRFASVVVHGHDDGRTPSRVPSGMTLERP